MTKRHFAAIALFASFLILCVAIALSINTKAVRQQRLS